MPISGGHIAVSKFYGSRNSGRKCRLDRITNGTQHRGMATKRSPEDAGLIYLFFARLLGANWTTTVSGYLTVLFGAIYTHPQFIQWLSEPWKGIVWNVSEYLTVGSFLAFAHQAKSKRVIGGTVQQDESGHVAEPQRPTPTEPKPAIPKTPLIIGFIGLIAFQLSGCANETVSNYVNPGNARIATALVCSNTLTFAVSDTDRAQVADYIYSIAKGIRTLSGGKVPTTGDVEHAVGLFSPGNSKRWASLGTSIAGVYGGVFAQIKGNPKLALEYLEAIAGGCEDAAAQFVPATGNP